MSDNTSHITPSLESTVRAVLARIDLCFSGEGDESDSDYLTTLEQIERELREALPEEYTPVGATEGLDYDDLATEEAPR